MHRPRWSPLSCAEFPCDNPALFGSGLFGSSDRAKLGAQGGQASDDPVLSASTLVPDVSRALAEPLTPAPAPRRHLSTDRAMARQIRALGARPPEPTADATPAPVTPLACAPEAEEPPTRAAVDPKSEFARLLAAIADVALQAGATRWAALLPELLARGSAAVSARDDTLCRLLERLGIGTVQGSEFRAGAELQRVAEAWRRVLEGESTDLTACGSNTLDEWALGLLAPAVTEQGQTASKLRRALRQRGVAAFGMRRAA